MERQQVWFNADIVALHAELKQKGVCSEEFPDFVKSAVHDKIRRVKAESLDLSKETIAHLAREAVKRETALALKK